MERKIKSGADRDVRHRSGVNECPHCEECFSFSDVPSVWDKSATILVLSPYDPKSGCVALVAECVESE